MEKIEGDVLEDVALILGEDDSDVQRKDGKDESKEVGEPDLPIPLLTFTLSFLPARSSPNNYEAVQLYSAFETHSQIQAPPQQKTTCNYSLLV